MTVYTAYFSFIMFVLLLFLVNSYFLLSLTIEKRKDSKIQKQKEKIMTSLINLFENENENANREEEIEKLKDNFNKKISIEAFHHATTDYYNESTNKNEITQLLEEIVDIKKIQKSGIVRKEYKESYTLYLISEFNMGNQKAGEFALSSLSRKSLHVRNNALNVINKNKDLKIFMKAIEIVNKRDHYFNDKMIIDFLDNYKGDRVELDRTLYLEMANFNTNLRKNIIGHFTNMNNGSPDIRDRMLDLIKHSNEKEIIISSIRYFYKIIDQRAKSLIIEKMDSNNWEVRATSARTISKYSGKDSVDKLKQTLTDENYYVRSNSAESFLRLVDVERAIEEAVTNEDRFARDILVYAMNISGIMTQEKYEYLANQYKETKSSKGVALV